MRRKRTHGQFDAALAAFERAVAIGRERHDPAGTVVVLNAAAAAQTDLWRVDEARTSLETALALARERKMETLTPSTVGQLGTHLTQIEQFAAAIPLLEESLAQAVTVPSPNRTPHAALRGARPGRRRRKLSTLAALRQGRVTLTTPVDLNGRGTTVALPDHSLFWAGCIVVGEP